MTIAALGICPFCGKEHRQDDVQVLGIRFKTCPNVSIISGHNIMLINLDEFQRAAEGSE